MTHTLLPPTLLPFLYLRNLRPQTLPPPQTSLHQLVINPAFLFPLYFIRGQHSITGRFLYIYAIHKGWESETQPGVCTSATDRVHTISGVSSDILL